MEGVVINLLLKQHPDDDMQQHSIHRNGDNLSRRPLRVSGTVLSLTLPYFLDYKCRSFLFHPGGTGSRLCVRCRSTLHRHCINTYTPTHFTDPPLHTCVSTTVTDTRMLATLRFGSASTESVLLFTLKKSCDIVSLINTAADNRLGNAYLCNTNFRFIFLLFIHTTDIAALRE